MGRSDSNLDRGLCDHGLAGWGLLQGGDARHCRDEAEEQVQAQVEPVQ